MPGSSIACCAEAGDATVVARIAAAATILNLIIVFLPLATRSGCAGLRKERACCARGHSRRQPQFQSRLGDRVFTRSGSLLSRLRERSYRIEDAIWVRALSTRTG